MNKAIVLMGGMALLVSLCGCVSAERKAEYAAWLSSEDGIRTVQLSEFEAKYKQGWRSRAMEKRRESLAREAEARALARRQGEYRRWMESDDKVDGVTLEVFEQKYKSGWEARAKQKKQVRLAREAKERNEAELRSKRNEVLDALVATNLVAIRRAYTDGRQYGHAYYNRALLRKIWKEQKGSDAYKKLDRELEKRKSSDWLKEWVEPRLGLSEEDKLAGEALLSEFGNKFMPNAYANYERVKDLAKELQQIFNEEFPEPWTIKNTNPKWKSFNKVLEKFAKARTEYFMCHDELCYYWMRYRLGVLSVEDFVKIDSQKLAVKLLPENLTQCGYEILQRQKLEEKDAIFAAKYAPESYALYVRFEQEWKQIDILWHEVGEQRTLLDAVRFDRAWHNTFSKCNDLVREINALVVDFQTWHIDHRTTEKSSEDVAKCDQERAKGLKAFADSLPMYVKERTLGSIIPAADMIAIPGRKYKMQRTEVTQMQWMLVMGNNPSYRIGPDSPVETVSWNDCRVFINKLNEMDGLTYRFPTVVEWEYACGAGSTGEWGKRRNGEEGPLDAMGWYCNNSGDKTHATAMKEPNTWGIYDMHGNVWEWCMDDCEGYGRVRANLGGAWSADARACVVSYRSIVSIFGPIHACHPESNGASTGFRLAASAD